ncbi:MAG: phosphoribosylaminoimidazolesuccinocarboxamide synthase [Chloroflexota bacterium]
MSVITETKLNLPLFGRGKVRDTYDLGDRLLIVATDRISAFDFVLPNGIPDKGAVLNQLSAFWFEKTAHIIPNHVVKVVTSPSMLAELASYGAPYPDYVTGRAMVVKKAERIPVECVVRGYISGSAWVEYQSKGTVTDTPLPPGLKESQLLAQPLFTPTTKAEAGHDEPLTPEHMESLVGKRLATDLKKATISVYEFARDYARQRGIIIADTKFEFGIIDGKLSLIDELLTPDSSRFWDVARYQVGTSPSSFDKQPVRDWLVSSGWNKEPPTPILPPDVVKATTQRYREAFRRLTGKELVT